MHSVSFPETHLDLLSITSSSFFILEEQSVSIGKEPYQRRIWSRQNSFSCYPSLGPNQRLRLYTAALKLFRFAIRLDFISQRC